MILLAELCAALLGSLSWRIAPAAAAVAQEVMIVKYHAGSYGYWITLANVTDRDIDLTNWQMNDYNAPGDPPTAKWKFPDHTIIKAKSLLVVEQIAGSGTSEAVAHGIPVVKSPGELLFGLSRGGDKVLLWNADGQIADELIFNWEYPDSPYIIEGFLGRREAYERVSTTDTDTAADWTKIASQETPIPAWEWAPLAGNPAPTAAPAADKLRFDNANPASAEVTGQDGAVEAGSTVKAYGSAAKEAVLGSATATATGSFALTFNNAASLQTVYVTATAPGKSESAATALGAIVTDTVPPVKVSNVPADGAADAELDAIIKLTFNEPVAAGSMIQNVSVKGANNSSVSGVQTSVIGNELTIAHAAFEHNTTYTVTVPASAVKDMAGNGNASDIVWSFTTVARPEDKVLIAKYHVGNFGGWITLANVTAHDIDLTNWQMNDYVTPMIENPKWKFPDHTIIKAKSLLVVETRYGTGSVGADTNGIPVVTAPANGFNIAHGGEKLLLWNASGQQADELIFNYDYPDSPFVIRDNLSDKMSVFERKSTDDTNSADDWKKTTGGTPIAAWVWAPLSGDVNPPQTSAPDAGRIQFNNATPSSARVTGRDGAVEPNAKVILFNPLSSSQIEQTTTATGTGSFEFTFNNSNNHKTVSISTVAKNKTGSATVELPAAYDETTPAPIAAKLRAVYTSSPDAVVLGPADAIPQNAFLTIYASPAKDTVLAQWMIGGGTPFPHTLYFTNSGLNPIVYLSTLAEGKNESELVALPVETDTVKPAIVSLFPQNGATQVAVDAEVKAVFNEHIKGHTAFDQISIKDENGVPVSLVNQIWNEKEFSLSHAPFAEGKTYTVRLPANSFSDYSGNVVDEDIVWSFTTSGASDTTPPDKLSSSPEAGATNASRDAVVKIVFNEPIAAGTALQRIAIKDAGGNPVAGVQAAISGSELTIAHDAFAENTVYTVTVPAQAVKDAAGNGNASEIVWSFKTADATAAKPVISLTASESEVPAGTPFTVKVNADDYTNVYGTQVQLTYDPARLQLQDENASEPGVQVKAGTLFAGGESALIANKADAGTITFAGTLVGGTGGATGTEPASVIELTFIPTGPAYGETQIGILSEQVKLAGYPSANPAEWQLPFDVTGSPLKVNVKAGGPDTAAPTWPEGGRLEAGGVTSTGLTLNWPAASDNVGVIGYKILKDGAEVTTVSGSVNSYTVNGLTANTAYAFEVQAGDAAGNWSAKLSKTVTTTGGSQAGKAIISLTASESEVPAGTPFTVKVNADDYTNVYGAQVQLTYDPARLQLQDENTSEPGVQVKAGKLFAGRESALIANNVDAGTITFAEALVGGTAGVTGTEPASVIELTFVPIGGTSGNTSVTIAADQLKLAGYPSANPAEWQLPFDVTGSPLTVNVNTSGPDTAAPTWPEGSKLEADNVTHQSVTLKWPPATDNTAVKGYKIYREELATVSGTVYGSKRVNLTVLESVYREEVGTTPETLFTVTGLKPDTVYNFFVEAGDAAGNWSKNGPSTQITTKSAPPSGDAEAPRWPEGSKLEAEAVTQTNATLRWTPAVDNMGVANYKITKDGVEIGSVSGAVYSYNVTGLSAGTTYLFQIQAGDAAGNWSANGPSVRVTTKADTAGDTEAPVWPQGSRLEAASVGRHDVSLKWPSATDNVQVTSYRIYKGTELLTTVSGAVYQYSVGGLSSNTTYAFEVQAGDAAGNWSPKLSLSVKTDRSGSSGGGSSGGSSGGSGGSPAPTTTALTPTDNGIVVPADMISTTKDGAATIVTIDDKKLADVFALLKGLNANAQRIVFHIDGAEPTVTLRLSAGVLADAAQAVPNAVIVLHSGSTSYELPINLVNLAQTAKEMGAELKDMKLNLTLTTLSGTKLNELITGMNGATLLSAAEFKLSVESASGSRTIDSFNGTMVKRMIAVPSGADLSQLTGVRIENGQPAFVPTVFRMNDGVMTAVILSPVNSVYGVLQHKKSFNDIAGHWSRADVELLASKLVVQGTSESTFSPDTEVTRAEFAALLVRALGMPAGEKGASFGDITPSDWFYGAVSAASKAGFIEGFEDGSFRPNAKITREQMAVMISRALKAAGKSAAGAANGLDKFSDQSKVSGWAKDALGQALEAGIISGMTDSTIEPAQNASRAQSAVMLKRLLQFVGYINP
nr:Ig-like domain-containing protein [Paenibacillus hamazuiensis]